MGLRVRAAALGLAVAWGVACDGPPAAEAARTPFEQLAVDSAAGDSAAFASLPPALEPWLDVRELLTAEELEALPLAECRILESVDDSRQRRRLRLRLADTSVVLLYAVADAQTAKLDRVEFIRRTPRDGQRGILWDGDRDRTISTWWTETPWGLSRRVERGELPRGGPVPRAMRGLGRRLFVMPCEPAERAAPTLP